ASRPLAGSSPPPRPARGPLGYPSSSASPAGRAPGMASPYRTPRRGFKRPSRGRRPGIRDRAGWRFRLKQPKADFPGQAAAARAHGWMIACGWFAVFATIPALVVTPSACDMGRNHPPPHARGAATAGGNSNMGPHEALVASLLTFVAVAAEHPHHVRR